MNTITVILTGGASRRMGQDKAVLPYRGGTLLTHLADTYRDTFDAVGISMDRPGRFPCPPGTIELPDRYTAQGPMAGLHAAFVETSAELVFLTAVDLPYGTPAAARALAGALAGHDACLLQRPNGHGGAEPAFAVYHRRLLPAITTCLEAGKRSFFMDLFPSGADVLFLASEALPGHDWSRIFTNVNHPEEYQKLLDEAT